MTTINDLLELLAAHNGAIVSTAVLSAMDIRQAQASGRMYVDENSLGYVWMPQITRFPETPKEVEEFERWFPLEEPLPINMTLGKWVKN